MNILYVCACGETKTTTMKPPQECVCGREMVSKGDKLGRYVESTPKSMGPYIKRLVERPNNPLTIEEVANLLDKSMEWVQASIASNETIEAPADLRKKIEDAINRCSAENGSNTPDFILAEYLLNCLTAFVIWRNC